MGTVGNRIEDSSELLIHRYSQGSVHEHLSIRIDRSNSEEMSQAFYHVG